MPTLYSYTIPIDDGAAPNPFHGLCTLAICKPAIRRNAEIGDWVVGLGSKRAPSGDLSGKVVYAMKVSEVVSIRKYDQMAKERWAFRLPDISSKDLTARLGDCLYDYSRGSPKQRPGVHGLINMEIDLGGDNVLISNHFYYFGSNARPLPKKLRRLCHQTQGHKSYSNADLLAPFVEWIDSGRFERGQLGWPDYVIKWKSKMGCQCVLRKNDDERDEIIESLRAL